MKHVTLACLMGLALLTACSSNDTAGTTGGSGGATTGSGYGVGGPGGAGTGGAPGQAGPGSEEDLATNVGDRIYFDTDRSTINAQAAQTLDKQASWLQQYPQVNIWIAGNCDDRGTEEYNLALGQRRANADRDYLVSHGISRDRIQTISYGKDRPIDAGSGSSAWAQNRNAITSVR